MNFNFTCEIELDATDADDVDALTVLNLLLGRWVDGVVATYVEKHVFPTIVTKLVKLKHFFFQIKISNKSINFLVLKCCKIFRKMHTEE